MDSVSILVVDDEILNLQVLSTYLSDLGYDFAAAENGTLASKKIRQNNFDIVITDIKMPGMNGFDLISFVRVHSPSTDVMVMTGFSDDYGFVDIIRAGAVEYLVKPFSQEELHAKLTRVVRERKLIQELKNEIIERRRAEQELQKAHHELERRVEERTAELRQAYQQLERETAERQRVEKEATLQEERNRLSRELHDSVTQSLYGQTLFAETGIQFMENGEHERLAHCLRELSRNARTTLKEMRLLVYNLRQPDLENEGLIKALQNRLEKVEERAGIKAEVIVEQAGEVSAETENALYRIGQEALNNCLKHAQANRVTITIRIESDWAELRISDNGKGFDPEKIGGGLGLVIIRERAENLGGSMAIDTAPGAGTTIRIRVRRFPERS